MISNQTPWMVSNYNHQDNNPGWVFMTNLQYLDYLLNQSRMIGSSQAPNIRILIWDFEELKAEQHRFYSQNATRIELELTSLRRILSYESFRQ